MKETTQIIVDENDEIIGHKPRHEITSDDIYRCSALGIRNTQGDILLAQRGFLKRKGPGKWSTAVAGTVDTGETYDKNIYKEAEEEIGISGYTFEKGEIVRRSGRNNYFCQWYHLVLDKPIEYFTAEEGQVETIRWVSIEEMKNLLRESPEIFTSGYAKMMSEELL